MRRYGIRLGGGLPIGRVALHAQRLDRQLPASEEGQTFAEYVMVLALVAIAVATSVKFAGSAFTSLYSQIQDGVAAMLP
jgi:Flp pilus assembly pilin Flp